MTSKASRDIFSLNAFHKKMTTHSFHLKQTQPKDCFSLSRKKRAISEDKDSFGFVIHFLHFIHGHKMEK